MYTGLHNLGSLYRGNHGDFIFDIHTLKADN